MNIRNRDVFCDGCGRSVREEDVVSRVEPWVPNAELCTFCQDAPEERAAFTRGFNHGMDKLADATLHTAKNSGLRRKEQS